MYRSKTLGVLALVALSACAEQTAPHDELTVEVSAPTENDIESRLYPPELVMDHQAAIGLTQAQREAIRGELQSSQRELVDAELALRADREALASVLAGREVDEDAAMQAATRVADGERGIKLAHMRLLLRIKNQLTAEQQRSLDRLRAGL